MNEIMLCALGSYMLFLGALYNLARLVFLVLVKFGFLAASVLDWFVRLLERLAFGKSEAW